MRAHSSNREQKKMDAAVLDGGMLEEEMFA
jgi:hypothetical protein